MEARARRLVLAILTAASALAAAPQSTTDLVGLARAYLTGYQKELSYLLADEATEQHVSARGQALGRRLTRGEFFLTYVPGQNLWMSVHDVADVDGQPVGDRDAFHAALQQGSLADLGRRLLEQNSRFNIGHVTRNFNEPTLALAVLDVAQRSRFKFDHKGSALTFKEIGRPTFVRSVRGRDVAADGRIELEDATGRVLKTSIHFDADDVSAWLTTTYERDAKLDIWVPARFEERYERSRNPQETVLVESTYTNYRRFQATVRIR